MRVILASVLLFSTPALGQQSIADVPPSFFSPTLMRGWQLEPPAVTREQQIQFALKWAEQPTGDQAQKREPVGRTLAGQQRSTVGQGIR
jgi:hypothetical protein